MAYEADESNFAGSVSVARDTAIQQARPNLLNELASLQVDTIKLVESLAQRLNPVTESEPSDGNKEGELRANHLSTSVYAQQRINGSLRQILRELVI